MRWGGVKEVPDVICEALVDGNVRCNNDAEWIVTYRHSEQKRYCTKHKNLFSKISRGITWIKRIDILTYETSVEIEIALAKFFDARMNLIVPKISWGMELHECDVLILSRSGFATEIEIKVTKSDIKNDKKKRHGHKSDMIKRFYYAVPEKIDTEFVKKHVPERAGIIVVDKEGYCKVVKKCKYNMKAGRFTDEERLQLARLGAIRIWKLKRQLVELKIKGGKE